jgi:hypothetical protein
MTLDWIKRTRTRTVSDMQCCYFKGGLQRQKVFDHSSIFEHNRRDFRWRLLMSLEYLAMYIGLRFGQGVYDKMISPVRHFASSRTKISDAIKSGKLFTDMNDANSEWDLIKLQKPKELSVLFDTTLPGRENIIKGHSKNMPFVINLSLFGEERAHASKPSIGGPEIYEVTLFYGMKTVKNHYPTSPLDIVHWQNYFTKQGHYGEFTGPSFERNVASFGGFKFEAITFRNWYNMVVDS